MHIMPSQGTQYIISSFNLPIYSNVFFLSIKSKAIYPSPFQPMMECLSENLQLSHISVDHQFDRKFLKLSYSAIHNSTRLMMLANILFHALLNIFCLSKRRIYCSEN